MGDALRVISYGGGVQSTALLVLAAQRHIDFRTFLFANVGDDSEDPATLNYVEQVAKPYAAEHGIDLHKLHKVPTRGISKGKAVTLYDQLTRSSSRSLPIPVRMSNGAPGTRSCTAAFKIKVIGRWLKRHGASAESPGTVGLGISLDEIERVNARIAEEYEVLTYPLLFDLDRPRTRQDCVRIIADAGIPVPPKSACWFCPFHRPQTWAEMRRDRPDLFERACALEDLLNSRRDTLGKDHVYLTRFNRPLREVIGVAQDMLPLEYAGPHCDNGWCMT